ncbi:MAG: GspH/FimT family pseudopilin [Desulfuromonadaceae bacterium]
MKTRKPHGFTLLEVIIVIAMMSIMLGTAYFYLGDHGDNGRLKSAAADLTGHMNFARTRAIRDGRPWALQFNPGTQNYLVLDDSGEPYGPEDPADPIDWTDGDETIMRSVNLSHSISFGSHQGELNGYAVADGVTYTSDRIVSARAGQTSSRLQRVLSVVVMLTGRAV